MRVAAVALAAAVVERAVAVASAPGRIVVEHALAGAAGSLVVFAPAAAVVAHVAAAVADPDLIAAARAPVAAVDSPVVFALAVVERPAASALGRFFVARVLVVVTVDFLADCAFAVFAPPAQSSARLFRPMSRR